MSTSNKLNIFLVFFLIIPGYNIDTKCDAFSFLSFFIFPPFSNRPQQEAPAAGGLHLTENSQSCHSEERSDVGISGKMLHRHSGLLKNQSSPKFRRERSCERKPSGFPFASNNPPQRQNCKIMLQNSILQFGKQLVKGVQRGRGKLAVPGRITGYPQRIRNSFAHRPGGIPAGTFSIYRTAYY